MERMFPTFSAGMAPSSSAKPSKHLLRTFTWDRCYYFGQIDVCQIEFFWVIFCQILVFLPLFIVIFCHFLITLFQRFAHWLIYSLYLIFFANFPTTFDRFWYSVRKFNLNHKLNKEILVIIILGLKYYHN
jgi:hypothetical protein